MSTQIEILKQFPQNKGDMQALACDWSNHILEGNSDPIKIAIRIKALQTILDQVTTTIKDYVLAECEKYGEKSFEKEGARIDISDLGARYDYAACNDSTWDDLSRQIEKLTDRRKAREKFLIAIPENGTVDPETGELIHRPSRTATRGIKITIK